VKLSNFGERFTRHSGVVDLMEDLGSALNDNPEVIFMGGGNPARLPEVESAFQSRLEQLLSDPSQRHQLFGIYQPPKGDSEFCQQVAALLKKEFGWQLSERNIAVSGGSQSAFFVLFNMFAGAYADGVTKTVHLPMAPEYIGYSGIGLDKEMFSATRPLIEKLDDRLFKYHVDFSQVKLDENIAALAFSRPTNPTGNVITDEEVAHLDSLARQNSIPLIIDGAYGLPFPKIVFNEAKPHWNENTVLVLSLSKLGLPGARTGIIVASEEIVKAYSNANTVLNLACSNMGPAIGRELFSSGEVLSLSANVIAPFYRQRAWQVVDWFRSALADLPCRIHRPEGAIFLWLWFEGLPITSQQFYERLKARGVLVVAGRHFFPGIGADWDHKEECIRVSYAQDSAKVKQGVEIIADEAKKAYQELEY